MLRIGLTGGIGAGKSAVARSLHELGAVVIDADQIAREVVEPGTPGLAAVVERFGPEFLLPDGSLDRAKLGAVVFADEQAREALNAIVHPLVGARSAQLLAAAPAGSVVVNDVPLLVESGLVPQFHLVVVVEAPVEQRLERLGRTRGMAAEHALARIAAQATDEQRRASADVVLVNDKGLAELRTAVSALWRTRLEPFARNLTEGHCADRPFALEPRPDAMLSRRLMERLELALAAWRPVVERSEADGDEAEPVRLLVRVAGDQPPAEAFLAAGWLVDEGGKACHADPGCSRAELTVSVIPG